MSDRCDPKKFRLTNAPSDTQIDVIRLRRNRPHSFEHYENQVRLCLEDIRNHHLTEMLPALQELKEFGAVQYEEELRDCPGDNCYFPSNSIELGLGTGSARRHQARRNPKLFLLLRSTTRRRGRLITKLRLLQEIACGLLPLEDPKQALDNFRGSGRIIVNGHAYLVQAKNHKNYYYWEIDWPTSHRWTRVL